MMKGVFLIFIAFIIVAFVYSKPIMNHESGFKLGEFEASTKKINNLSKRAVEPTSSRTGFATIISTESQEKHKKKRKCLKWTKEPITNRAKCVKFNVVPNSNEK